MTSYYSSEVGLPFLIIKRIRFLNAIGSLNALGLSLNALGSNLQNYNYLNKWDGLTI